MVKPDYLGCTVNKNLVLAKQLVAIAQQLMASSGEFDDGDDKVRKQLKKSLPDDLPGNWQHASEENEAEKSALERSANKRFLKDR